MIKSRGAAVRGDLSLAHSSFSVCGRGNLDGDDDDDDGGDGGNLDDDYDDGDLDDDHISLVIFSLLSILFKFKLSIIKIVIIIV